MKELWSWVLRLRLGAVLGCLTAAGFAALSIPALKARARDLRRRIAEGRPWA